MLLLYTYGTADSRAICISDILVLVDGTELRKHFRLNLLIKSEAYSGTKKYLSKHLSFNNSIKSNNL